MEMLRIAAREIVSLFVDDGPFAAAIVAVVALAIVLSRLDAPWVVTGGVLFLGCVAALAWSVLGARRR